MTYLEHTYAVIMAGGIGSRFWPKSRREKPKQYLSLVDDGTLIQNTTARLQGLFSKDTIYVVTTQDQERLLRDQLPWLPVEHILFESVGRNTAPAIGLAAIHLLDADPDAAMVVLPADHRITNTRAFLEMLSNAVQFTKTEKNALVTLGIEPTYPATGYGYIESGEQRGDNCFQVARFTEKPERPTAQEFLDAGNFYWNSGIFVWRADTILNEIQTHMPDLYNGLMQIKSALHTNDADSVCADVYAAIKGESIDFGILEKSQHVFVLPGTFGWNDLGNWEEVYKSSAKDENGNVVLGRSLLKDVKNSYVESSNRIVAVIGVDDLIVVDQPDALLICKKEQSQDVRWVTAQLKDMEKTKKS